ncbi:MAG: regulator, partial [Candidatus Omnitrophica bacterium]|nr:regulator [Candidatus Omnitrophota bacterium]
INCTELLSYLKTASVITGDEKYDRIYRELAKEKGYLEQARAPMPNDPALWTHIDASLLTLTLHALLLSEEDPDYLEVYREGVRQWYEEIEDEDCPLFSFTCGAIADIDIDAEACVEFLRDAPLDLIEWTVDNSSREDVSLVRSPELDHWQLDRLLPPSERAVMRWDKNPWSAVRGFGGQVESTGVYWLLPYWMGRYYGFIGAAE